MRLVMMDPISMVAFWFAVWGCSYTLSHLQGPFDLAVNLRRFVLRRTRPTRRRLPSPERSSAHGHR